MRECKEKPINGHYCCGDGKTVTGKGFVLIMRYNSRLNMPGARSVPASEKRLIRIKSK